MSGLLLTQKVHGHLAILAVALALHPVLSTWRAKRPTRRTRLSGYLAALLTLAANVLGWLVYPAYRELVKPELYAVSVTYGQAFEVKEHLAFYALCLSLAGAALLWAARGEYAETLRGPARTVWLLCFLCGLGTGVVGVLVASVRGFA